MKFYQRFYFNRIFLLVKNWSTNARLLFRVFGNIFEMKINNKIGLIAAGKNEFIKCTQKGAWVLCLLKESPAFKKHKFYISKFIPSVFFQHQGVGTRNIERHRNPPGAPYGSVPFGERQGLQLWLLVLGLREGSGRVAAWRLPADSFPSGTDVFFFVRRHAHLEYMQASM